MDTEKTIVAIVLLSILSVVFISYIIYERLWIKKEKEKIAKFRQLHNENIILTALEATEQSEAYNKNNIGKYKEKLEYYANENFNCIMRAIDKESLKSLYYVDIPYYFLITPTEVPYKIFNLDMVTIIRNNLIELGYKVRIDNHNNFVKISDPSPSICIEWRR